MPDLTARPKRRSLDLSFEQLWPAPTAALEVKYYAPHVNLPNILDVLAKPRALLGVPPVDFELLSRPSTAQRPSSPRSPRCREPSTSSSPRRAPSKYGYSDITPVITSPRLHTHRRPLALGEGAYHVMPHKLSGMRAPTKPAPQPFSVSIMRQGNPPSPAVDHKQRGANSQRLARWSQDDDDDSTRVTRRRPIC